MTIITSEAVTQAIHKVVEKKGADYIYPNSGPGASCFYSENGAPSCIVGWVVADLDAQAFDSLVEYESAESESFTANELGARTNLKFGVGVEWALSAAQEIQDNGGTWGLALQAYERVLAGEYYYYVVQELKAQINA